MLASALIGALSIELGESPQDGDTIQAFLGFIRDTVQEINIMGEWQHTRLAFPFSTDQGVSPIPLPETVGSIISIQRVDTGRPLKYISLETMTASQLILTVEGEPAFWNYESIQGAVPRLRLYPIPDDSYSYVVDYEDSTHEISSEDSTLPVPNDFIPVLKHGVRVLYYAAAGDEGQMQLYERRFERGVQALRGRYESVRLDRQNAPYNDLEGPVGWPTPQLPSSYPRIG